MSFLSPFAEFQEAALIQMEADTGYQTFTWHGLEVLCIPTGLDSGLSIGVGPKGEESTGRLVVRRSAFLTIDTTLVTIDSDLYTLDDDRPTPVAGKKLIFRGQTRRILSAKEDGSRGHYTLELAAANK